MRNTRIWTRARRLWPLAVAIPGALALAFALGGRLWAILKLAGWALVIAYLLSPLVERLSRYFCRALAVAAAFVILLSALAGIICALVLPAINQFIELAGWLPALYSKWNVFAGALGERMRDLGLELSFSNVISDERVKQLALTLIGGAVARVKHAFVFFARFAAVLALAYFNLIEWERITLRLELIVPARARGAAIRAAGAVRREMGMYLRGQAIIICCVSALAVLALTLCGAPSPLALGLTYGLMNALPYFGPLIGTVPPVLAALAVSWQTAFITLAALLLIQQIDNYVLSPRVIGSYSGLTPSMVLLTITAGSCIGGVIGMFAAMPALLSIRVMLRVFLSARE